MGHKHTLWFKPSESLFSKFLVLSAVMAEIDVVKQSWLTYSIHVNYVFGNLAKSLLVWTEHLYNVWILKWGKWSMYLLAFDYPRSISCPPHVTLKLFQCCRLPVCCHLPQHIIHYFPNGLLLICVNRLVHSVDRTRAILFHVLFNLPRQSGESMFCVVFAEITRVIR